MPATFGILGSTTLLINGQLREGWGRPRERAVLTTLLVHSGRWVPLDTLIEWAWPEDEPLPQHPVSTFHNYAHRIRQWLQQLPSPPELQSGRGGYRLDAPRSSIDFYVFRGFITEAREHARAQDYKQAVELAGQALELWRGPPLAELDSELARAWRTRVVQDEWIPAHTTLLQALIEVGNFDEALVRLADLQADLPLDVRLAVLRLSALHGSARYTDATAYYLSTRHQLLNNVDEQAAEYLRQHYDALTVDVPEQYNLRASEPTIKPRQLPHDIGDFVGRENQLAALDAATDAANGRPIGGVVILDGMPGVGKTALAVHWAHRNRHRFPDGDLHVNLCGFSDSRQITPAMVVDDFLIALGHPPVSNMNSRSRQLLLSKLLADRRTLVLLDNARDTAHVEDLIPLLSSCLVIVTSRQWLSKLTTATGARRVRVDPMPATEATELLSQRLRQRRQVDDNHLARMALLCAGLPLAVIMLAEHVATRPDAQLAGFADHLNRRQLIADIGEDGDGSVNLQTFFTWSYRALAAPEQRLFLLLGLNPGSDISLEAACAGNGRSRSETTRSLGLLVGAHLLEQPDTFSRYRFHDLISEFAAACAQADLSESARQAAERRYLSFYLASAVNANHVLYPSQLAASELPVEAGVEPMIFTESAQAQHWLDQERTNLISAATSGGARGYHEHVWRLADAVTTFLDRRGRYEDSRALRELAAASARHAGNRVGEASSLVGLGMLLMIRGDYTAARRCLGDALHLVDAEGHERGQATVLNQLGRLEMLRGNSEGALSLYQCSLDIAKRIEDHEVLCWTHYRIGEALRLTNQHDQAFIHLRQAQWLAEHIEDNSAHASSLAEIGSFYRDRNDHIAAVAYCEQALVIAENIPDLAVTAQVCIALAEINTARADLHAAIHYAQRAVAVCHQTHNLADEARAHDVLGDAHFTQGHNYDAARAWQQATLLYDRIDNYAHMALVKAKIDKHAQPPSASPTSRPRSPAPGVPPPDALPDGGGSDTATI